MFSSGGWRLQPTPCAIPSNSPVRASLVRDTAGRSNQTGAALPLGKGEARGVERVTCPRVTVLVSGTTTSTS